MIDGLALLVLALPHSNGSAILHELMKKDANNEAIFTTKAKAQLTDYFFDLVAKRAFNAMRYLIAMKNIEINAIDEHLFSYTPLMWAASMGHLAMVKYLVQNGADMSLVDEHGETALDLAKESGHDEVVEYLERVMKKA